MENTYWNNQGTYQADYERLQELVPDVDNCPTVAGEMMLACSRLVYDFYNNGMGNNTSGALNFLREHEAITEDVYNAVYEFTRGRLYVGNYSGDSLHRAIEMVVDQTIEKILENPELETTPNTEDMFDYSDEDEEFEDSDDDWDDDWDDEDEEFEED